MYHYAVEVTLELLAYLGHSYLHWHFVLVLGATYKARLRKPLWFTLRSLFIVHLCSWSLRDIYSVVIDTCCARLSYFASHLCQLFHFHYLFAHHIICRVIWNVFGDWVFKGAFLRNEIESRYFYLKVSVRYSVHNGWQPHSARYSGRHHWPNAKLNNGPIH